MVILITAYCQLTNNNATKIQSNTFMLYSRTIKRKSHTIHKPFQVYNFHIALTSKYCCNRKISRVKSLWFSHRWWFMGYLWCGFAIYIFYIMAFCLYPWKPQNLNTQPIFLNLQQCQNFMAHLKAVWENCKTSHHFTCIYRA